MTYFHSINASKTIILTKNVDDAMWW